MAAKENGCCQQIAFMYLIYPCYFYYEMIHHWRKSMERKKAELESQSSSFKGFFPGIDQWSAKWSPSSAQQRTTVNSVTLWQQCFLKTKEKLFSKHEESLVVKPVDQISSWEISGLYMLVKYLTRYRYQLSIHAITGCPSRFWITIKSWLKLD